MLRIGANDKCLKLEIDPPSAVTVAGLTNNKLGTSIDFGNQSPVPAQCTKSSWHRKEPVPLTTRFMGPTWGPPGADMTQVGPMLAPWTLLSGPMGSFGIFFDISLNKLWNQQSIWQWFKTPCCSCGVTVIILVRYVVCTVLNKTVF